MIRKIIDLGRKQQKILSVILAKGAVQSSVLHKELVQNGEKTSLVPFKKIFVSQYEFAAKNYAVK